MKTKSLIKPVLLSVLSHGFAVLLFALVTWKIAVRHSEIILSIAPPLSISEQRTSPPSEKKQAPVALPKIEAPISPPSTTGEIIDSIKTDSIEHLDPQQFFAASPFVMFKKPPDSMAADSDSIRLHIQRPGVKQMAFDSINFKATPGPFDRIQRDIEKQNRGGEQPLPLGPAMNRGAAYLSDLFNKKKVEKPVRFDFIPSETEIQIFKILWQHPRAADHEIYAALDTSIRITAVDLNRILARLTNKGVLKRKIISPRNEFTLPVGKVEMSAKNRRNRVYEYETKIQPQELLTFLQAVLYETENGKNRKLPHREARIASLRKKILQAASASSKH